MDEGTGMRDGRAQGLIHSLSFGNAVGVSVVVVVVIELTIPTSILS